MTATSGNILISDGVDFDSVAISDDASISASGALTISSDAIEESMLKAVDTASDEEILTYETTSGDFEWHAPSELVTAGTNISWSSATLNVDDAFNELIEQIKMYLSLKKDE